MATIFFYTLLSYNLSAAFFLGGSFLLQKSSKSYAVAWQYRLQKLLLLYFLFPYVILTIVFTILGEPASFSLFLSEDFRGATYYSSNTLGVPYINRLFFTNIIFSIWIIITVTLLLARIGGGLLYLHFILKKSTLITSPKILQIFDNWDFNHKPARKLPIFYCPLISSPALVGIIKPLILLNRIDYSPAELKLIIAHEMTHYYQHDIIYRFLAKISQCINWFNPIIYLFELNFYDLGELSCDEKILNNVSSDTRKEYALLLLNLSSSAKDPMLIASIFCNSTKRMERRLYHIMKKNLKQQKKMDHCSYHRRNVTLFTNYSLCS